MGRQTGNFLCIISSLFTSKWLYFSSHDVFSRFCAAQLLLLLKLPLQLLMNGESPWKTVASMIRQLPVEALLFRKACFTRLSDQRSKPLLNRRAQQLLEVQKALLTSWRNCRAFDREAATLCFECIV
jgi:hypothetical protein